MDCTRRASSILLITALALMIQLVSINQVLAQDTNTTSAQNQSTIKIIDPENHTITIIDTKTNKPISVSKYTPEDANKTTSDAVTTNSANGTTSEILTPEEPMTNNTLTPNTENATTTVNLTDKFDALQGK